MIPERDFKDRLKCSVGPTQGYSHEIYGVSDLVVHKASSLAYVELLINDYPIARADNPEGLDRLSIPTVGAGDCLLTSPNTLRFSLISLRAQTIGSDLVVPAITLTFIPWLLDASGVSGLDLAGFHYYSEVGPWPFERPGKRPSHIYYAGGAVARKEGAPPEVLTLRESVSARPLVRDDRKLLHLTSDVDVAELLPAELILEKDPWKGQNHRTVSVPNGKVFEAVALSRELGAQVLVSQEIYWTNEQREEMIELSNAATDAKYALYCEITGAERGPRVDHEEEEDLLNSLLLDP